MPFRPSVPQALRPPHLLRTDPQTDKDALALPPTLLFLPFFLHGFLLLKVAADKSIYLGQIVSEKLPLELFGTKLPLWKGKSRCMKVWTMAKCVAATAATAAEAGAVTKSGLIGAAADWFEMAPLSPRCGEPHWLGPESHFSQTPNKSQFLFYKAREEKKNQFMFELGKLTCWIIGRHALSVCLSHALKLLLPLREEWGEENGSKSEPSSPSAWTWEWALGIESYQEAWALWPCWGPS